MWHGQDVGEGKGA